MFAKNYRSLGGFAAILPIDDHAYLGPVWKIWTKKMKNLSRRPEVDGFCYHVEFYGLSVIVGFKNNDPWATANSKLTLSTTTIYYMITLRHKFILYADFKSKLQNQLLIPLIFNINSLGTNALGLSLPIETVTLHWADPSY